MSEHIVPEYIVPVYVTKENSALLEQIAAEYSTTVDELVNEALYKWELSL